MTDHILRISVRGSDCKQFFIDMELDGLTYAVLGPYDTCPTDSEAQIIAMSCVRLDGYNPYRPLILQRET